jgi:hypothetical protein
VSQENVEIVQRAYAHTRTTGLVYAQALAPDFAWDMSKFPWPEQQLYEGAWAHPEIEFVIADGHAPGNCRGWPGWHKAGDA